MKRMRRLFAVSAMILVLLNVWPQICNAQADPGDDPDAPIDGGIGLLIAAGIAWVQLSELPYSRPPSSRCSLVTAFTMLPVCTSLSGSSFSFGWYGH